MKQFLNFLYKKRINPNNNKELGILGEDLATEFLKNKKYKIIYRNWKYKNDEIDIICLDGDILVFVEVKLRDSNALVGGYYSVTKRKKIALKRAINQFKSQVKEEITTDRFDIIEIALCKINYGHKILHFENIPLESIYDF